MQIGSITSCPFLISGAACVFRRGPCSSALGDFVDSCRFAACGSQGLACLYLPERAGPAFLALSHHAAWDCPSTTLRYIISQRAFQPPGPPSLRLAASVLDSDLPGTLPCPAGPPE